jgi:hypothetical protein
MPAWQWGQVPSLYAVGAMTRSPLAMARTSGADLLGHADELVADRAGFERRLAAICC